MHTKYTEFDAENSFFGYDNNYQPDIANIGVIFSIIMLVTLVCLICIIINGLIGIVAYKAGQRNKNNNVQCIE